MYETKTIKALTTDGQVLSLVVPAKVDSKERGAYLSTLYKEHVTHPDGHWKSHAVATVPAALADDVADAMDFMGSIVDERSAQPDNMVSLSSKGYWAHGF